MPWGPNDAPSHTKKANSPQKRRQWAHVANNELNSGKSDKIAIMAADAAVAGSTKPHHFAHKQPRT